MLFATLVATYPRQAPDHLGRLTDPSQPHYQDVLASGGAPRIHLEQLPAYAPELNPVEGRWYYLKRVELRNLCCRTLAELRYELRLAVANLRHKRAIVRSFAKHCGY